MTTKPRSDAALIAAMKRSMKAAEKAGNKAPLSETLLQKDATPRSADSCAKILREMVEARPEKVISRNYFRVHSPIAESVWNAHFGTFHEFKRQAGIVLTRQQHNLERQIAKHASVDHYRKLSAERSDWGERYVRPSGRRWQTMLVAADLHDEEVDPFYLRVLLDTARRAQPDIVAFAGDLMDLADFSRFTKDPREFGPVRRIQFARQKIVAPLREAVGDSCQIDLIEGNHEFHILRHFADETPGIQVILAELHGMDIRSLFKLDEYNVNWVGKANLSAFRERDIQNELKHNYRVYWDSFLCYHYPDGRNWGMPGCNGHNHKEQVWPAFSPVFGSYVWRQIGCGHKRDASYAEGEKWSLGFNLVHIDTRTRSILQEYVTIADHAMVGGKLYVREPGEFVTRPLVTPISTAGPTR